MHRARRETKIRHKSAAGATGQKRPNREVATRVREVEASKVQISTKWPTAAIQASPLLHHTLRAPCCRPLSLTNAPTDIFTARSPIPMPYQSIALPQQSHPARAHRPGATGPEVPQTYICRLTPAP